MSKRKICLFTAHSPLSGGGGVILRSLIEFLPEYTITWYYTGDSVVPGYEEGYLGESLMGGAIAKDIWQTWKMLAGKKTLLIEHIAVQLSKIDCDQYWIVSHNEGLRLALELARKQERPVHMTIHDDWAGALCARSVRYRFMAGLAKNLTIKALKAVSSFDVVSAGMRDYYEQLSGIKGGICHRYLSENSIKAIGLADVNKREQTEVVAGHIGSIYDKDDFIAFLSLFNDFAKGNGKKALIKMWGCHLTINDIPDQLKERIVFYPTLSENEVIPQLSRCAFVYAMYPLSKSLRIFSKTSLPTKLTSYLQAGRPVFGHGPADSTLAAFINSNNLGVMWDSQSREGGFKSLNEIFLLEIGFEKLSDTRKFYFGEANLEVMKKALLQTK